MDIERMVIYQDEALLVVDKPAGLPTLVDGYHPDAPFLVGLLKKIYNPLWIVHRLDRYTSGVMVFALTSEAHRDLNTQFEGRQASKIYHALVMGNPEWSETHVHLPLRPNGDRKHRTVIDHQRGKPSHTELHVLEYFDSCCLVEARPHTGRTHQIRAHLAALGHPILFDPLYRSSGSQNSQDPQSYRSMTGFDITFPLERLALHARSLELAHPIHGAPLTFEAPYPGDLMNALRDLRK